MNTCLRGWAPPSHPQPSMCYSFCIPENGPSSGEGSPLPAKGPFANWQSLWLKSENGAKGQSEAIANSGEWREPCY